MNSNISKSYTFSALIERYKIEVPIIQRDYAQGRQENKKLRGNFLANLYNSITKEDGDIELDFIYGEVKDNVFYPLDGQQRLTTLFLLHWYIAVKNDELETKENLLSKFTYETRTSSREFCCALVKHGIEWGKEHTISDLIKDSNWFYLSWLKDPTIKSMLTMLDAIHEKFKGTASLSWEALNSITFYFIELRDFGLSDDLYIKMNARGKQLTGFENFKAELVQRIKELKIDKDKKPTETIAHKLDTTWTDIFWKNRSKDAKIDEIYFAFINRLFLNQFITSKSEKDNFSFTAEEIEEHDVFKTLYGHQSNDTHVKYDGFDIYNGKLNEPILVDKKSLDSLAKTLDGFYHYQSQIKKTKEENGNIVQTDNSNDDQTDDGNGAKSENDNDTQSNKSKDVEEKKVNQSLLPQWDLDNSFRFIPTYSKEKDSPQVISTFGQKERIVFHAICRFFEKLDKGEKDIETPLKQWMRVVWNIVENGGVNTINSMIGTMRLIDELSEHSHSIYKFLASNEPIKSHAAAKQVAEEREKAKQILYAAQPDDNSETWETLIIKAEKRAFFKGAIRFLFTDEKGKYDWDLFNNRFDRSEKYFIKEGVQEIYADNAILLRSFISFFDDWDMFWNNFQFNNDAKNWKHILTDKLWLRPLSRLLSASIPDLERWTPPQYKEQLNEMQLCVHKDLVTSSLISKILNENYKLNWRYGRYSLYPHNTKAQWRIHMIGTNRNAILAKASGEKSIKIDGWHFVEGANYFKGWDIQFTYESYTFQWYRDGFIYIVAYDKLNNNELYYPKNEKDEYISFPGADIIPENFTQKLDELIREYRNNQS